MLYKYYLVMAPAVGLLPGVKTCTLDFCKYCVMDKQCRVSFKAAK